MAVSRKRPYRRRGATLNTRIRRIDRDIERKTLGKWYAVQAYTDVVVGSTKYGAFIALPRPSNKLEIYGMDLLIGLSLKDGKSESAIQGALLVCHDREGQDPADFVAANSALPNQDGWDNLARPRSFLPFLLINEDGIPQRNAVIPYSFFRGHKIVLNPNQRLLFWVVVSSATTAGVQLSMNITGRYRFIQTHS